MAQSSSSELTYLFKPVENKVPCGGFNYVGGGVIGKDFVVNSNLVTITGYYDIEDCVAVKGTTNIYLRDNLKFMTLTINARPYLIFDNHVTSGEELGEVSFKYLQDNCITWSAIEYLNTLLSFFSVRCTGIGVDAVSKFFWENFVNSEIVNSETDSLEVQIYSVFEGQLQSIARIPSNIKILTKEVSQDTTTPGLYFTPTGATYIFTKGQ